jgi:hypothetical protein
VLPSERDRGDTPEVRGGGGTGVGNGPRGRDAGPLSPRIETPVARQCGRAQSAGRDPLDRGQASNERGGAARSSARTQAKLPVAVVAECFDPPFRRQDEREVPSGGGRSNARPLQPGRGLTVDRVTQAQLTVLVGTPDVQRSVRPPREGVAPPHRDSHNPGEARKPDGSDARHVVAKTQLSVGVVAPRPDDPSAGQRETVAAARCNLLDAH